MALPPLKSSLSGKLELTSLASLGAVCGKLPAPRLVTLSLKGTDKTMRNISLCYVLKALDCVSGKVNNASYLKKEPLLLEVRNDKRKFS